MPHFHRIARFGGAVLFSAAGWWFGTGLHPLWPLLWVAPVPVLLLSANLSPFPALETGADILVGISRRENERNWNEALLFTADGQVITYDKRRRVQR